MNYTLTAKPLTPTPEEPRITLHTLNPKPYLEVRCTYNLLGNCRYNPIINPITTVTPDIIWVITTVTK